MVRFIADICEVLRFDQAPRPQAARYLLFDFAHAQIPSREESGGRLGRFPAFDGHDGGQYGEAFRTG